MVINEIRTAVVDTINFIIPPIVKLIISLIIASYITHGVLTNFWLDRIQFFFHNLNIDTTKSFIDKLYLSSIIPIIFILILVAFAYLVNRTISFIGSMIPFSFITGNQLVHHYNTRTIWSAFPSINSIYDLDLKINQIVERLKIENNSPYLENLKWRKEKMDKEFSYLNFIYFVIIFSITCFISTRRYLTPTLLTTRLYFIIVLSIIILIAVFFRIAYHFFATQEAKLRIVEYWLKSEKDFLTRGSETNKEIEERINTERKYNSRWWSVSFGYRIDWITMFKYYRFRLPFYSMFQKWKYGKAIKKKPYR